jgi:hypothetical protein
LKDQEKSTFLVEQNELGLPLHLDGTFYGLESLEDGQKDIIAHCLKHLKNWVVEWLTIRGVAGSGKITFINALVTTTC